MSTERKMIVGFLGAGALLAVGISAYLGLTAGRGNAFVLADPAFLAMQVIPFALCGLLWLPWRGEFAARTGRAVAALLFVVTALIYLPLPFHREWVGGDMVGLGPILVVLGMVAGLLVISLAAWIARWVSRWRRRGDPSSGPAVTSPTGNT